MARCPTPGQPATLLHRLGLYQAMTGVGPLNAPNLAAATGLDERLVTEWLAAQTVSGYVTYDPVAGTYHLARRACDGLVGAGVAGVRDT